MSENVLAAELVVVTVNILLKLFLFQSVKDRWVALVAFLYHELNVRLQVVVLHHELYLLFRLQKYRVFVVQRQKNYLTIRQPNRYFSRMLRHYVDLQVLKRRQLVCKSRLLFELVARTRRPL